METSSADHAAPGLSVIGVAHAELVLARPSTEPLRQTGVQPAIVTPLIEIRLLLVSSIGQAQREPAGRHPASLWADRFPTACL